MTKFYDSNTSLQQKLLEGVNVVADNVASTLGPRGRNVIIHKKGENPVVTKDGVTVAKFIDLEDPFQNAGAQILKQASEQTNIDAGDGTTTATILARAIFQNSQKYLAAGSSPTEMKRGMDKVTSSLVENLNSLARPISSIEDVRHVATISANGDETIGEIVSLAVDQAGKDGAITIEEARSLETSLDVVEGFRFDSGYLSPQFITDERRGAIRYNDCLVLVTDSKIETVEEILPVLEVVARESRPFLIVAESVEGQALAALIMNAIRGTMKVAAVKAPYYGQQRRSVLKDLALSVGATFVSREAGVDMREINIEHLGKAGTVDITKNSTTIVDGDGSSDEIDEKIESLKIEIDQTDNMHECAQIQNRITRLASGIAMIRVGAPTEIEMIEKKHRFEDALEAVKSAQGGGVVPGGGVALVRAAQNMDFSLENQDQFLGARVVLDSIKEPILQMARNAGESPDIILGMVEAEQDDIGYDFSSRSMVDMVEVGIIDPMKVTKTALLNAVSVASTLITTNYTIVEK